MKKILLLLLTTTLFNSCYVFRAYKYRNFQLDDVEKLPAINLAASDQSFQFVYDTANHQKLAKQLDSNLEGSHTYAFLVIRNDSILYERYFGNVNEQTKLPSFSVAKSVTSTLLGIALDEGYIKSTEELVINYIPKLKKRKGFEKVTIQQVLDMRSGVKGSEEYTNPFSDVLKMGFANNVRRPVYKATIKSAAGTFDYKSLNTQILAMIVENATGKKLQDYATEKLWAPLQMEFAATWNADKKNMPRAFCCINAAARDYAKFGRLILKKGNWQGKQLVSEKWFKRSTNVDTMRVYGGYKNQWWSTRRYKTFTDSLQAVAFLATTKAPLGIRANNATPIASWTVSYYGNAFHAEGILNQYVYINPDKNLIIVRLGHHWSHPRFYASNFLYAIGDEL